MFFSTELFLFLLGLAFGSFINVVSLRFSPGKPLFSKETIGGRSHCASCGKTLKWYELIPFVSFFIQFGKCRSCKKNILFQYPLVELACGFLFVSTHSFLQKFLFSALSGVASQFLIFSASFLWILVWMFLLVIFIVDIRHYMIPNFINFAILALGIIWVIGGSFFGVFDGTFHGSFIGHYANLFDFGISNPLALHFIGALFASLFFLAIVILSSGRAMGMGDVKFIFGLGMLFGFPDIVLVVTLSFIIGAIASLVLMIIKTKTMKDMVPFGPFIAIASSVTFFFGSGLLRLYFDIIGLG